MMATLNNHSILPTAAKPRQMLALLALRPCQVVSVELLVEEVWGDNQPSRVRTATQTYIMQIRRLLSAAPFDSTEDAKQLLITRHNGYTLDFDPEQSDAWRFVEATRAGFVALDQRDYETASVKLEEAIQMWRGPALVDVDTGTVLRLEVERLNEYHRCAQEAWVEAELNLKRYRTALSELVALRAADPLNERLCGLQMAALYDSGRTPEALNAFRDLSRSLRAELGVTPSRKLVQLHESILRGDFLEGLPSRP
ncbi:AfsR/SARP family transcriptional regulator [Nocardia alba]|nr:AfsR/SARP family transcriptional regulator [Nocardia alba]